MTMMMWLLMMLVLVCAFHLDGIKHRLDRVIELLQKDD